mgnify:CR=1 FL=1
MYIHTFQTNKQISKELSCKIQKDLKMDADKWKGDENMSVVIIGGNERMERQYPLLRGRYHYSSSDCATGKKQVSERCNRAGRKRHIC